MNLPLASVWVDGGTGLDDPLPGAETCIEVSDLRVRYGAGAPVLRGVSMRIPARRVTAVIGPSGCGKSTFLRCLNRMNDLIDGARVEGEILLEGRDIHDATVDVADLRRRVGMVFQQPHPFPMTIYENVAYGLRLLGLDTRAVLDNAVEKSLKAVALWNEVKGRLHASALGLSAGQQQRLLIARTLAIEPEVILFDEPGPASLPDPAVTARIEELICDLKERYTVVIVTHDMQRVARVSDYTAFMRMGELVEFDDTRTMFTNPRRAATEDFITGRRAAGHGREINGY